MDASIPPIPMILKKALWIWPDSPVWDLYNCYALFRREFTLEKVPSKAPLYVTADQSYQLYLNGRYICRGPARGFQKSWPYDEIDVRPWLKKGRNVLAVRAYNPGRSSFQYVHQGYAGFLLAAQWGKTLLLTDSTWKCRRQRGVSRDTVNASLQLFPQENIDLRIEHPDWMQPSYKEDASWNPREISTSAWNAMPWESLEPRGIPLLEEKEIRPGKVIGFSEGRSAPGHLSTRDLAENRFNEGLAHSPCEGKASGLRFGRTGTGRWQSFLIDLGKLHVGSVLLDIPNAKGDEIVETHHYETLGRNLTPDYAPDLHCRVAFSHRLTCRKGRNSHAFFLPFGFRYMLVTVRNTRAALSVRPSLRTSVYPLRRKGSFTCSDPALNRIWSACAWTQQVCSLDAYVDTPWREQAQWWGDARLQAWNTFHLDGDPRLFRRGIRQIASQTAAGITYGHAPTTAHNCILPDFTLIWMLTLWDYYWQTGSLEPFLGHQKTIEDALAYFREWTDSRTGLLRYDPRFWLFLDWTDLRSQGCSSVYSLWLLYVLDRLERLHLLAKNRKKAAEMRAWAASLRKNLAKLIGPEGLMRDGYTPEGKIDPETSVHSQTLALMNRLAPRHEAAMLEKRLLPYIRKELKPRAVPSAYWITYVFAALAGRGHGSEVIADIRERWTPMAKHGTTWENFAPRPGDESHSHAWSAHPLFHLMQILGGIRQSAPGWKEITFQPHFLGTHADVTIPTPLGPVRSAWKNRNGKVSATLSLPRGMRARIRLPKLRPSLLAGPATRVFEFALK